jgi:putative spermidine/putrescine transport system permease protein
VLLLPAVAYLLAVFVAPLIRILGLSLFDPGFTLRHFQHVFRSEAYLSVLLTTFEVSGSVTVLTLVLGYPVAYVMARSRPPVTALLTVIVLLPFLTSILVRSFAWMVILGRQGLVNTLLLAAGLIAEPLPLMYNRLGVYIGLVQVLLPMMILPLYSTMTGIDRHLLRASASLGAGRLGTFWKVFFPLSLPGVVAGSLLVFIQTLGFFITPALLGGRRDVMIAQLIELQLNQLLNWGLAAAIALILLGATLTLFVAYTRLVGVDRLWGGAEAPGRRRWRWGWPAGEPGATTWRDRVVEAWRERGAPRLPARRAPAVAARGRQPSTGAAGWLVLTVSAVAAYLTLPILIVLVTSFSASEYLEFPPRGFSLHLYVNYLTSPVWMEATLRSFRVALVVTALATALGTLAAFPLSRSRFPGRELITGFLVAPLILPAIVTSLAIYYSFSSLRLIGSDLGLVLAHTLLGIPFVVLIVSATLAGFDRSLERASLSLGAGPLRTLLRVTLPVIRPGLLTAAAFAFLVSFDELVIALFISGVRAATLPKQMWDSIHDQVDPTLSAVSAVLIAVTIGVLLLHVAMRRVTERVRRAQMAPAGGDA